jgi:cell division protease FtsH
MWALILVITVLVAQFYFGQRQQRVDISYTRFVEEVKKGNIQKIDVNANDVANEIVGELKVSASTQVAERALPFKEFRTWYQGDSKTIADLVWKENPGIEITMRPQQMNWWGYLGNLLPFIILIGAWLFILRQMQSGGSAALKFGKSRAKVTLDHAPRPGGARSCGGPQSGVRPRRDDDRALRTSAGVITRASRRSSPWWPRCWASSRPMP